MTQRPKWKKEKKKKQPFFKPLHSYQSDVTPGPSQEQLCSTNVENPTKTQLKKADRLPSSLVSESTPFFPSFSFNFTPPSQTAANSQARSAVKHALQRARARRESLICDPFSCLLGALPWRSPTRQRLSQCSTVGAGIQHTPASHRGSKAVLAQLPSDGPRSSLSGGVLGSTHHHGGRLQTQGAPAQEEGQPCQHGHPASEGEETNVTGGRSNHQTSVVLVLYWFYSQDEQPAGLFGQAQQDEQTHDEVEQQQEDVRQPPAKHNATVVFISLNTLNLHLTVDCKNIFYLHI